MIKDQGFTLVELLIALMIFSLVSIGTLSSVNHMMRAREHQRAHHEINLKLDQAYAHFFQDLLWFVGEIEASEDSLSFVRTASTQEEGKVRVHYLLKEGELWRQVGDQSVLILSQIEGLDLSWLIHNQVWVSVFNSTSAWEEPLLLRVKFQVPQLGEVIWVYSTPHL